MKKTKSRRFFPEPTAIFKSPIKLEECLAQAQSLMQLYAGLKSTESRCYTLVFGMDLIINPMWRPCKWIRSLRCDEPGNALIRSNVFMRQVTRFSRHQKQVSVLIFIPVLWTFQCSESSRFCAKAWRWLFLSALNSILQRAFFRSDHIPDFLMLIKRKQKCTRQ